MRDAKIKRYLSLYGEYSLSTDDMLKLCEDKTNIVSYPQIKKYKDLDELLGKYGCCIILYLSQPNYGHWTCIFKVNKDTIECFDPYGVVFDDELKWIDAHFRKTSGQKKPILSQLIYDSGYNITYNDYQLQEKKSGVATCGRWVSMRIILRKMPLDEFVALFTSHKTLKPDWIVTILTL